MDALQGDIDALEGERSELKEKLKMLSKKTLLEGLTRQTGSPGIAALVANDPGNKITPFLACLVWNGLAYVLSIPIRL